MTSQTEDIKRILREWVDGEKELKQKQLNIDSFDTKEGEVNLKQRKTKKALSGKFILTLLNKYLESNTIESAEEVTKYLLDNREVILKDIITLK